MSSEGAPTPVPPARAIPGGSTLLIICAACALLVVIAAFLPWATALGFLSVSGVNGGDGVITLLLGIVGIALSLWGSGRILAAPGNRLVLPLLSAIAGGIVMLVGIIDLVNIGSQIEDTSGLVSPGAGLVLTVVFGIAWFALAMTAIFRRG